MVISAARRTLAATLTRGATERWSGEVERALSSRWSRASPERIERILAHAAVSVPFHRGRGRRRFEDLPVVGKPEILADPAAFLADGADPERLATRVSSGTSGIIFRSFFDAERMRRHRAELVGAYRFLGADPFGAYLYCRAWDEVGRGARAAAALRGHRLSSGETDEASVRATAAWLGRRRGTVLIGLSSYLESLLERFEELGTELPAGAVGTVLGMGEPGTAHLAGLARRTTGTPLTMRYSSTELGLIGFTRPGASTYSVDTSTFHVEILALDADVPAAPGALGRIVVTDLFNRAMPFIRYDTGDLGRHALSPGGKDLPGTLAEVAGRMRDVPIAGTAQAPRRATHFGLLEKVEPIPQIRQFQLRQHDIGRFTWLLHAPRSPQLDARLRRILDDEIGDILSCEVVYLDGPLVSGTEKRQTFVTEIPDPGSLLRRAAARAEESPRPSPSAGPGRS